MSKTLAGTGIIIPEQPEVTAQEKAMTDAINTQTSQILKDLGLDQQVEQADLAKSEEYLHYVRGNPDSEEAWREYEGWRNRRLRSREPVPGKLLNGKPKYVWIKVTNVCSRFMNAPIPVPPGDKKDFTLEKIPEAAGSAQCIVFYNQMDPENPDMIKRESTGMLPLPASCAASVIAKHFEPR